MADTPNSSKASDAAKRETLTSRAKRIIGRALETPKDEKDSDKKGPPKKPTTKRREQVLQAQRTHRQRTQGYIRELEKEVLRLRGIESSLKSQNGVLSAKVQILEQTLVVNNITIPDLTSVGATSHLLGNGFNGIDLNNDFLSHPSDASALSSPSPAAAMSDSDTAWSTISGHTPAIPGGYVNVDLTSMHNLRGFKVENHCEVSDTPRTVDMAELQQHPHHTVMADTPSSTSLDSQEALDFVLGVEKVCFSHLKHTYIEKGPEPSEVPNANYGLGHAYMAVTNLINQRSPEGDPTAQPFQVPAVDLQKMFNASLALNFGSDVTPIQLWDNLTRLVGKGYLIDREFLRLLTNEFKKYSRCNGYGAVVERSTANAIISYYFPGEQYVDPKPA